MLELPAPDAADIHVDEIRLRVVSDATALKGESRVPEIGSSHARQTDIDRHGLHVQALASDSITMRPQEFIAPGRAVPADYADLGVGLTQLGREIVQQVENPGVVVADVAGTVVTQIPIQAIKRFGKIPAALAIDDIQAFPGMQMKELEAILRFGTSGVMDGCGSQQMTRE
jgi:hypothetical protein